MKAREMLILFLKLDSRVQSILVEESTIIVLVHEIIYLLFKVKKKKKRKLIQNSKLLAIYHYTSPRETATNCSTLSLRVYVTHVPKGFLVTK